MCYTCANITQYLVEVNDIRHRAREASGLPLHILALNVSVDAEVRIEGLRDEYCLFRTLFG